MTGGPVPTPAPATSAEGPPPEGDAAAVAARIEGRIEAMRRNPGPRAQDWQTLFRQLQDAARALAEHPFLSGDAEAIARLNAALAADDLEALDRRIDRLAEYVEGKVALRMALLGQTPPPPKLAATSPGATRAAARHGPSGDDFALPGATRGDDAPAPRRVLRL
ncbi:MAG: hypothetical protein ACU0BF_00695 [Paracoccaceae bacterium]